MKVYELIQELCAYDADCEVEINCQLDKVAVYVEDENGDEKTVFVDFDDTSDIGVTDRKTSYSNSKKIVVLDAYYK